MKVNPVAIPGTKYGNYLEQHHDIVFVPMAFESMGATGRTFTTFLRLVSEQAYENSKRAQADFRAKWRRKIGLALVYIIQWQSNTLFLLRHIRHTTEQDGLGYVLNYGIKDKAHIHFKK